MADLQLDTSGLRCPQPILKTKELMSQLDFGKKLLVISTDPSSQIDFKVYTRQTGCKLLKFWQDEQGLYYLLQK